MGRLPEVLDEIHRDGVVYIVRTHDRDTRLVPSGLVDDAGEVSFVLGPPEVCGRVLGLVDAEYGWPQRVDLQDVHTLADISPGRRRHPFLHRGATCLAVSIMIREYEMIREQHPAATDRKEGS